MNKIKKFFGYVWAVLGICFLAFLSIKFLWNGNNKSKIKIKKFKRRLKKDAKRYNDFLDDNPPMDAL